MIVPCIDYEPWVSVDAAKSSGDIIGCIGHEVERERDEKPRRPIGFRLPEKAPDPSWMLL